MSQLILVNIRIISNQFLPIVSTIYGEKNTTVDIFAIYSYGMSC